MRDEERHDVVIVGAGAAGVSCALECFDIQLDTVVYETTDEPGGQLAEIPHSVRNVAVGRFENGRALRQTLEDSSAILGDRLRVSHSVTRADLAECWVEANGTRVHGTALVLCTGTARKHLPAAVDGAFGGDVTYQLEPRRDFIDRVSVPRRAGADWARCRGLGFDECGFRTLPKRRTARGGLIAAVAVRLRGCLDLRFVNTVGHGVPRCAIRNHSIREFPDRYVDLADDRLQIETFVADQ